MKSTSTNTVVHSEGATTEQMLEDIIRHAKAIEYQQRFERVMEWERYGHIRIDHSHAMVIKVRCDDMVFEEPREVFPSVELIAKLALAVKSGLSCRDRIHNFHNEDALAYTMVGNHNRDAGKSLALSRMWCEEFKALKVDKIIKGMDGV